MLHLQTQHHKLKAKAIVTVISDVSEISVLNFLQLSDDIIQDIHHKLSQKESFSEVYFIPHTRHKHLYILCSQEKNYKAEVLFFGKHLSSFPKDFCIITHDITTTKYIAEIALLSRYKFLSYKKSAQKDFIEVLIETKDKKQIHDLCQKIENIFLARDLGETPANDLTPEIFAQKVRETKFSHTKVKVLNYKEIHKRGLGLLEAVGKGSENKPCMVILEHIRDKKQPIIGIIGKGVTFDTGGNQIKPGDHMYDMKGDMGGAAVTFALMKELDRKNIKKNFVACLVLAENVVSSNSYKPSDILKAYNGKTVEIIHTDAEGRLVLADGISYIGKHYKTSSIITLATLTGACIVALGHRYAGVMGNDESLISKILEYSKTHTEQYVRLPFDEYFQEKTKSEIADYKNLDRSVMAGSSMGAAFLSNFLENNEAFTHIDIAGVYINSSEAYGKMPKGMTGFGVESLSDILSE